MARRDRQRERKARSNGGPLLAAKVATYLGLVQDDEQALQLAHASDLPAEERQAILEAARGPEFEAYRTADAGAVASHLSRAVILQLLAMLETVDDLPPTTRWQTLRAVVDALEMLGGSHAALTHFVVNQRITVRCGCGGTYTRCTSCSEVLSGQSAP